MEMRTMNSWAKMEMSLFSNYSASSVKVTAEMREHKDEELVE